MAIISQFLSIIKNNSANKEKIWLIKFFKIIKMLIFLE
jgi:hypothetical protein